MVPDVIPEGHSLLGRSFNCTAPADEGDMPILPHRSVCLPFWTHQRGPNCLCEPVVYLRGEVEAPAFCRSIDYRLCGPVN